MPPSFYFIPQVPPMSPTSRPDMEPENLRRIQRDLEERQQQQQRSGGGGGGQQGSQLLMI